MTHNPDGANGVCCPRCGSNHVTLLGKEQIISGTCIGICKLCRENFVVPASDNEDRLVIEQAALWEAAS